MKTLSKETVIEKLISNYIDTIKCDNEQGDNSILYSYLSDGFKGFYNYTIDELKVEYNEIFGEHIDIDTNFYYDVHVTGKEGFSVCIISDKKIDDDEIILLGYQQDKLHDDDCHFIDSIDEISFDEWNEWFNCN